ncbi:MAG TPA: hypothetical protein VGB84_01220 [Arachidicoccus sp.]
MKQFFVTLFLMIVFNAAYTQVILSQINSDGLVLQFVKQKNYSTDAPQWNHFYLTRGDEWKDYANLEQNREREIAQLLPSKSWLKSDLNGDGKDDLMVSGYVARSMGDRSDAVFKMLVFLSTAKKNDYDEVDLLNEASNNFPAYCDVILVDNVPFIRLYKWILPKDEAVNSPVEVDTLQYNSFVKNFVNYAAVLYPSGIRRIDYSVKDDPSGSYHSVNIVKMPGNNYTIQVILQPSGNKKPETHSLRIKKDLFNNVDSLVRHLHIRDSSTILDADDSSENLPIGTTIYYVNGTKKIIHDYGQNADYTLLAIYKTMEDAMSVTLQRIENRNEFWGELIEGIGTSL